MSKTVGRKAIPVTDEFILRLIGRFEALVENGSRPASEDFEKQTGIDWWLIRNKACGPKPNQKKGEYTLTPKKFHTACDKTLYPCTRAIDWNRLDASDKSFAISSVTRDFEKGRLDVLAIQKALGNSVVWSAALADTLNDLEKRFGLDRLYEGPSAQNPSSDSAESNAESDARAAQSDAILARYCRQVVANMEDLFSGKNPAAPAGIEYYIAPQYSTVIARDWRLGRKQDGESVFKPVNPVGESGDTEDADFHELLDRARDSQRICVAEDSGTGKTIFTRRMLGYVCSDAGRKQLFDGQPCLAVRWEARQHDRTVFDWPAKKDEFQEQLTGELRKADSSISRETAMMVADHAIESGRLILIVDAMDQLAVPAGESEPPELKALTDFLRRLQKNCWVIMTSRLEEAARAITSGFVMGDWLLVKIMGFDLRRQYEYLVMCRNDDEPLITKYSEEELTAARTQPDQISSFLTRFGVSTAKEQLALLDSEHGGFYRKYARDPIVRKSIGLSSSGSIDDCFRDSLLARFPNHDEIGDLFELPIVLWLVRKMCSTDATVTFHTRTELYDKVCTGMIRAAAKTTDCLRNESSLRRLDNLLSAFAFEMSLRPDRYKNETRAYAVGGLKKVGDLREAVGVRLGEPVADDDWKLMVLVTNLTDRSILETCSDSMLGFRHRSIREFYCGKYLVANVEKNWTVVVDEDLIPVANASHWKSCWRFAIELETSDPEVKASSLRSLFRRPHRLRRPTELMHRAFEFMNSTESGRKEIRRFQAEFPDVVSAGNAVAKQLVADPGGPGPEPQDRNYVRCPLDPADFAPFWMGSGNYAYESPRHRVAVKPFALQSTTVTRAQFALFDEHYETTEVKWLERYASDSQCPAIYVSWNDAWCFCKWIGGRLPTETEWEYACRAGNDSEKHAFHLGNQLSTTQANFRPKEDDRFQAQGDMEDRGKTMAVRSFEPNAWGLWQMHGNVWEWCEDYYSETAYRDRLPKNFDPSAAAQVTPIEAGSGPPLGSFRVLRGGSWGDAAIYCRSASRDHIVPDNHYRYIGFRVCRDF